MTHKVAADAIFLVHAMIFVTVLFGWAVPDIRFLYMLLLVAVLLSDLFLGYCILSKWEFNLRKKFNPSINYNYSWTSYYTFRLYEKTQLPDAFWKRASAFFLIGSLAINMYFRYFFA